MSRLFALGTIALAPVIAFACSGSGSGAGPGNDGGAGNANDGSVGSSSGGPASSSGGNGSSSSGGNGSSSGASGSSSGGSAEAGVDAGPPVGASVLMFHDHMNRDGFFIDGALTEAKAATLVRDTSFSGAIHSDDAATSGNVYASPLYVENGVSGKGTFYVATEDGTVFALDEQSGSVVWEKNVATTPTSSYAGGCGNVSPIGITGTPAIDLATRLIVFDTPTADSGGHIATHMIYALSIDTGAVAWSVDASTITDPSNSLTFAPPSQNQRSAVLILNGIAYVAYGGHAGDCGPYHGWVIGVPLSGHGTGAKGWSTQVAGAGIWGCGGPASDGESVFITTGNAEAATASWAESEGLFRLDPGPTFTKAMPDFFALKNWSDLDTGDLDLSGAGPLLIDAPSMTPTTLAMGQGKDGYLYLVDRTNLGGLATTQTPAIVGLGSLQVFSGASGSQISSGNAFATVGGATYVVVRPNGQGPGIGCPNGMAGDLVGVKLDPTVAEKMKVVWCVQSNGNGSPTITSSDGTNDPIAWAVAAGGGGTLYGWDLTTGAAVFTGGGANDTAPTVRSFTAPIVVHGRIFTAGDNQLYAYKVP